jgi:hypothetical protein
VIYAAICCVQKSDGAAGRFRILSCLKIIPDRRKNPGLSQNHRFSLLARHSSHTLTLFRLPATRIHLYSWLVARRTLGVLTRLYEAAW